jgi:hypothetical protein
MNERPTYMASKSDQPQEKQTSTDEPQHDVSFLAPASRSPPKAGQADCRIALSLEILTSGWRRERGPPLLSSNLGHQEGVRGKTQRGE